MGRRLFNLDEGFQLLMPIGLASGQWYIPTAFGKSHYSEAKLTAQLDT